MPALRSEATAYSRNCSRPQPLFATPMIGTSSTPRSTSPTSAGNVSSLARSPVAPKITSASTRSVVMIVLLLWVYRVAGQPSRAARWSPTRSALAMAVSDGFTAPMLGKKLVSTT